MKKPLPGIPGTHAKRVNRRAGEDPKVAFIRAAPAKDTLPWLQPGVRDDVMFQLHAAQPERIMLVMEWLAGQAGVTKRQWVEDALREKAERELEALGLRVQPD